MGGPAGGRARRRAGGQAAAAAVFTWAPTIVGRSILARLVAPATSTDGTDGSRVLGDGIRLTAACMSRFCCLANLIFEQLSATQFSFRLRWRHPAQRSSSSRGASSSSSAPAAVVFDLGKVRGWLRRGGSPAVATAAAAAARHSPCTSCPSPLTGPAQVLLQLRRCSSILTTPDLLGACRRPADHPHLPSKRSCWSCLGTPLSPRGCSRHGEGGRWWSS